MKTKTSNKNINLSVNELEADSSIIDLKVRVLDEIIRPNYMKNIRNKINGRRTWNCIANTLMITSKILSGCITISTFISLYYQTPTWAIISGSISTLVNVLNVFEMGASKKLKQQNAELTLLLRNIGLDDYNYFFNGVTDDENGKQETTQKTSDNCEPIKNSESIKNIEPNKNNETIKIIADIILTEAPVLDHILHPVPDNNIQNDIPDSVMQHTGMPNTNMLLDTQRDETQCIPYSTTPESTISDNGDMLVKIKEEIKDEIKREIREKIKKELEDETKKNINTNLNTDTADEIRCENMDDKGENIIENKNVTEETREENVKEIEDENTRKTQRVCDGELKGDIPGSSNKISDNIDNKDKGKNIEEPPTIQISDVNDSDIHKKDSDTFCKSTGEAKKTIKKNAPFLLDINSINLDELNDDEY